MKKTSTLNNLQAAISLMKAKKQFHIGGRGFGKSTLFGNQMSDIIKHLPGASGIIAAKTFTHVLTSILPSAFGHLERLGYIRDIHYVIGKMPPKSWGLPYQPPVKNYEHYITFFNKPRPVGFYLTSQEREGLGRGPNTDYLLTDETLNLDKEKMDNEIYPTLRANKDKFKNISWHLGEFHSTSMPFQYEKKWILNVAEYYMNDYGIDLFSIWKQIVKMQIEILDIKDTKEFKQAWNEMLRLKKKIKPRVAKDNETLFTLSNAFDNWQFVGLEYIRQQKERLPYLIFLVEIMNMEVSMNKESFYSLQDDNVYNDSWDDSYSIDLALKNNYNFDELSKKNAAFLNRKYYNPNKPIYLGLDWGGSISFCLAAQKIDNVLYVIKEFYVTPPGEMPKRLMQFVADFFTNHQDKRFLFIRDSYADDKSNSIQVDNTINEDAINHLRNKGFKVIPKRHKYKEPPYHKKWQLMQKVMNCNDDTVFNLKIDANNCKYLIISIKDTKVKQVGNKLTKDKSLERKKGADQKRAPHSTDALDKLCFFLESYSKENLFIPIN